MRGPKMKSLAQGTYANLCFVKKTTWGLSHCALAEQTDLWAMSVDAVLYLLPLLGKSQHAIVVISKSKFDPNWQSPWFPFVNAKPWRSERWQICYDWEKLWQVLTEGLEMTSTFANYPSPVVCRAAIHIGKGLLQSCPQYLYDANEVKTEYLLH